MQTSGKGGYPSAHLGTPRYHQQKAEPPRCLALRTRGGRLLLHVHHIDVEISLRNFIGANFCLNPSGPQEEIFVVIIFVPLSSLTTPLQFDFQYLWLLIFAVASRSTK